MLHDFLTSNRTELIKRCRDQETKRFAPTRIPAAISYGVPLFLQQVTDTLRHEQQTTERGKTGLDPSPAPSEIGRAAATHGANMLQLGFSADQVVHSYGDVCQSITAMAVEDKQLITADEFRTLNRCLDNAIADAVTSFGAARNQVAVDRAEALHKRMNHFSDEQQRLVEIAIQSYSAIKTGNVGLTGATGTLLVHALEELRTLAEHIVPEIRLKSAATILPPG